MSIARKLWLGFGSLLLIFVLASLTIFISQRSTEMALEEIVDVEEPTRAAAFEMEINTVEISRDVLDYLDTGDGRFRQRFINDQGDFEKAKASYDKLVDTERGVKQGEELSSVYERYSSLGEELLKAKDDQDGLLGRTSRSFGGIDGIFDETLDSVRDSTSASERLSRLADIQYDIASVNNSMTTYMRNPRDEYRQDVVDNEAEVREGFEAYRNLDLDAEEQNTLETLEERFDATMTMVNELLDSTETLREDEDKFAAAQIELDEILDEDVQPWTAQQLIGAEEDASNSIRNVYVTILVLLLVGLLVGALAASTIGRNILGSVRRLKSGADKVGGGDFEHRIEPYTEDELGSVALAFNGMLDKRQEADSALLESEERFRGLSEATFEGVVIVEDGDIIEANHSFMGMFGYEEAEILDMNVRELIAPESLDLVIWNMTSGNEEAYEARVQRKDGTVFDVEVRGRRASYRGRVVRMTAIRDVTERKQAEKEVREAEARYRSLVEQLPAVVYTQEISAPNHTTYMSPQIEVLQGYTPEETMSNPEHWKNTTHPDDREKVLLEDVRANETMEPFVQEYRRLTKDGVVVWVRDEAVVVRDENGEPAFWQGVLLDVSDRKAAEQELLMAEERFRGAFGGAAIGMALSSLDGRYIEVNNAMCEMLGYSEEQLLAFTFWDITHPEDMDLSKNKASDLLDGKTNSYGLEKRYLHADGHSVWVSLSVASVKDQEGNILYLLAQTQDITESKQSKEALEKSEERYRLVAQATKETIWDSDILADRQTWNGAVDEMLGVSEETETDAVWWEDHIHP
ncbi:MAG: PAS domain S-box protein, partial [Actinomycetota bacterium]|nr:PAS domain S-box protein [Actinomycetota bacterium]